MLQVNSVGVLSFVDSVMELEPRPFPGSDRVIAPYWSSVDLRRGGEVYYRTTSNEQLLDRAQEDILTQFPDLEGLFEPTLLLVATWFEVQELNGGNEVSKRL